LRCTVYIGVTYGGYGYPHFLEWGVPYPTFQAHGRTITVTDAQNTLAGFSTGQNFDFQTHHKYLRTAGVQAHSAHYSELATVYINTSSIWQGKRSKGREGGRESEGRRKGTDMGGIYQG